MNKRVVVLCVFFVALICELFVILYPQMKEQREMNLLTKEVSMVYNYIVKNDGNLEDINMFIKREITSGKRKKIEKSIDSCLTDILENYSAIKNFDEKILDNKFDINFSKDEINQFYKNFIDYKEKVNYVKQKFLSFSVDGYFDDNLNYIDKYREIMKKIDLNIIENKINIINSIISDKLSLLQYLNDSLDFFSVEGKIVFSKRKNYNEFNDLISNLDVEVEYELINDTEGPIITANSIVIYQGNNVSISDKISCVDEVDGEVSCDISGSYNNNVPGTYSIDIKAVDFSGNETSKKINIIVKEKEVYSKPYVIEVIRNQSTTIVYTTDDNGEYTKIVHVFPCSPGAGNNTPVGTFYSKRGYEWGSLYGGVYGQYSTIITGHVLFHSVPYYSRNKDDLVWKYYNRLGSKDSMGCVRLTVRDAKWIYDNCPNGTMIKIYDGNLPDGITKPSAQKIDPNDEKRGWDPTDPDPNNPWNN